MVTKEASGRLRERGNYSIGGGSYSKFKMGGGALCAIKFTMSKYCIGRARIFTK